MERIAFIGSYDKTDMIIYVARIIENGKTPNIGFYMIIAGGFGNIIDRIFINQ